MLTLFIPCDTGAWSIAFKTWFCLPVLSLPVTIFKLAELEHDLFDTLGDTYLDRQRSLQALCETSAVVTFAYDHAKV